MMRCPLLASTLLFLMPAAFQTPDAKLAIIDPSKADADFGMQGEYSGEVPTDDGPKKFGIQVIALGDGKFTAAAHHGGLPGDGWDKSERIKAEGQRDGDSVQLIAAEGRGRIKDGVLSVINDNGEVIAELKRVERKSPTLGAKPPAGAIVLFDGTTADTFERGRMTDDKLLMQGVTSKQKFQSFRLHLEFMTSYMPYARGQGRANSGCYLQGRYEVQILDSFGLDGKNNECGGIYEISDPSVNMCYPPLSWQTYDIDFTAARYDDTGKKIKNARMTVRHNGVVIQDDVELPRATRAAPVAEGPEPGPIYLQDHGNPIRFRNIWVEPK